MTGPRAWALLRHEAGGHRWQRIPPTEKRGRVHTSTVTVAVLREPAGGAVDVRDADLDWSVARGSGPGGQARNRRNTAVRLVHRPTGITVRVNGGRSLEQSRRTALEVLAARLHEREAIARADARNAKRKDQIGSGMRGDKVRTIRLQDDSVVDHGSGKKISAKKYLRGDWEGLLGD